MFLFENATIHTLVKIICIIIGFLLFLLPAFSFAQDTTNSGTSTQDATTLDLAKTDYRYNALLEFFLQKTSEKDFQTAYGYTSGNFQKNNPLLQFTKIVTAAGLTDYTAKKWTEFKDQMKDIGVTTVKGEFTGSDDAIHKITFYVVIGGETEIKVGAITEDITLDLLAKRIPQTEALHSLILADLKKITHFIRKNQTKKAYAYLSPSAHNRIKLKDVAKAFRGFRKKKLTVVLPKTGQIQLADPVISQEGMMIIQGTYANKKNLVTFVLGYDYEWEWKLGLFSINAAPLKSAGTSQNQAAGVTTPGTTTPAQ